MVLRTVTKLTKTNQNITIGSKKVDWVRSFRFWRESVVCFGSSPNRCIKCYTGMVFRTVTKLTKTNQNITIGSKKLYWVRSFCFWRESVVHFGSGPNRCIKCYTGMVFRTVTKLTKMNQNITIGSKKLDWVRSFCFWRLSVVRFSSGPNQCIKCYTSMVFRTVTKLTKTNQNITIGSKKLDWVRSFRFWPESVVHFSSGPNRCIKCYTGMVFRTVMKLTKTNQNITIGSKKFDWVRSFRFWRESVVRFSSCPNRCIKCYTGMVFRTVTKLTKTNQNITIGSKKLDWVRSFRFWHESVVRFGSVLNRCIKCYTGMDFRTVTKLTKTNQNISIGSKKLDWVRSFRFWRESVVRFGSGLNRCIKCYTGMVFRTVTKLTKTNQNITIGSKKVDWVRFWRESVVRFGSGPNRCIKCYTGMVFRTVTKLTKTNQNITIGSKKVDRVRSFRFWRESVVRFGSSPNRCIKCYPGMVFCTITTLTKTNQNITIGSKKVDWEHSFRFWPESVHSMQPGMVFAQ